MRVSFRGRLAVALVVLVVGGGAATAGDDLIACRVKGQIEILSDRWTKINPFPIIGNNEGTSGITDFIALPGTVNGLVATNGTVIKNSADGGCTWNHIGDSFSADVPNAGIDSDVFTHLASNNSDKVFAASVDDASGVYSPHVHVYSNLDQTPVPHEQITNGMPPVGRPMELLVPPISQDELYLLLEQPPDPTTGDPLTPTRRIYTTVVHETPQPPPPAPPVPRSMVWQEVTPPPAGFGLIQGIASPSSSMLWTWSENKIAITTLPDVSPTVWPVVAEIPDGKITAVDVNAYGSALVAVETEQGAAGYFVDSKGVLTAVDGGLPATVTSLAHGTLPATRALSGPDGTFGYDRNAGEWTDLSHKRVGELGNLQMGQGRAARILLGNRLDGIYRFDLYNGESFVPGADPIFGDGDVDLPGRTITDAYITPERAIIEVEPGKVKDVEVELGNPAFPNPLNVYFLIDTTSSMQTAIDGLTEDVYSIASAMRTALGRDACFGLGEFKDFEASVAARYADRVFRTHQKIGCGPDNLPSVKAKLDGLIAEGGGDFPEAGTVALHQMLSGDGSINPPVATDQAAGFQDGAYKVVVLISDAHFKQGSGYPTREGVAEELAKNAVKVVGLRWITPRTTPEAKPQMIELADATESYAPPGGIDCNADQTHNEGDVKAGEPLVCDADGTTADIGPVIIRLLLGVEDPGTLAIDVDDPYKVIQGKVRGTTSKIVDLKREARIGFEMTVGCTEEQDGLDLPVTLTGTARAIPLINELGELVRGQAIVRCRSIVPPAPPRVPRPVIPEPDLVPPAAPRPPAAVVVIPPPNPPAPVTNVNINAGFSQQEEQQFQLAAVTQGAGEQTQEDEEVELAMSALDVDDGFTPVAAFLASATALSMAAALAHRRRLQRTTRQSCVRVR